MLKELGLIKVSPTGSDSNNNILRLPSQTFSRERNANLEEYTGTGSDLMMDHSSQAQSCTTLLFQPGGHQQQFDSRDIRGISKSQSQLTVSTALANHIEQSHIVDENDHGIAIYQKPASSDGADDEDHEDAEQVSPEPSLIQIVPERHESVYAIHEEEPDYLAVSAVEDEESQPTPSIKFKAKSISVEKRPVERLKRQKNFRESAKQFQGRLKKGSCSSTTTASEHPSTKFLRSKQHTKGLPQPSSTVTSSLAASKSNLTLRKGSKTST